VITDASDLVTGAVLMQDQGKGLQPIAYESQKLQGAERRYPPRELELLAIIHALRAWRHYLLGPHFHIYTDHLSLRYLQTQPNLSPKEARWLDLLQEYDFEVHYLPGKKNVVADALSRKKTLHVNMISTLTSDLLMTICESLNNDEYFKKAIHLLKEPPAVMPHWMKHYKLEEDLLYFKN